MHAAAIPAPADLHNTKLRDQTHPPGWENPEPKQRYDLLVVGGGPAGLVCAGGAAILGARVALVEKHLLGGDCLIHGCVPSKALIHDANRAAHVRCADGGDAAPGQGPVDFASVMQRMRQVRADIAQHDSAQRFKDMGVDVFFGEGAFVSPSSFEVEGATLRFKRACIATGARANVPDIPGLADVDYLTNETLFSLTELPRRLAVLGGGPIGAEMAQAFARLGSEVTLVDRADRILQHDLPEAAERVQEQMRAEGVRFHLGTTVERVSKRVEGVSKRVDDGAKRVDGVAKRVEGVAKRVEGGAITLHLRDESGQPAINADAVLVAVGRRPNVEGLGLERADVEYSEAGIGTDDYLRTSNRRIYAAGDVTSRYKFTHVADEQARIVIRNALFFGFRRASKLVIPRATYTCPEVAHVGMHAHEAQEAGYRTQVIRVDVADTDRGATDGERGFAQIVLKRGTGRILGATIVSRRAGDLISEVSLAMTSGIGLQGIGRTIHPYPTTSELLRHAANEWELGKLQRPFIQKLARLLLRLRR